MATRPVRIGARITERVVSATTALQNVSIRTEVQQLAAQLSFSVLGAAIAVITLTANVAYTRLGIRDIFAIVLPNYGAALNSEALNESTLG